MGRLWIINWQWAMPGAEIPAPLAPDYRFMPIPAEWIGEGRIWTPTSFTDQWQLAAICFAMLTGELPPSIGAPPLQLLRPDATQSVRMVIDRALNADPPTAYH